MESLPNELLLHIMDHLDTTTLKSGRLVSLHWNAATSYRMKRDFQASIHNINSLDAIMKSFENKEIRLNPLPINYFCFSGPILWTRTVSLKTFCAKYGQLIVEYKVDCRCRTEKGYNPVSYSNLEADFFVENVNMLLKSSKNVEKIFLIVPEQDFFERSTKPLRKLKKLESVDFETITPDLRKSYPNSFSLLSRIAEIAPELSHLVVSSSSVTGIKNTVSRLALVNSDILVFLQRLRVVMIEDYNKIPDLIGSPIPLEIYKIEIDISNDTPTEAFQEAMNQLHTLISMSAETLLTLNMTSSTPGTSMCLPSLPCLIGLIADTVELCPSKKKIFEFPRLQWIHLDRDVPVRPFFGSVFQTVTSAQLSLVTLEAAQSWPLIIPNVEKAFFDITTPTLRGIFNFPRLVTLEVFCADDATLNYERNPGFWEQLTMGVHEIPDDTICTVPLSSDAYSAECNDKNGFKNLKRLKCLEFVLGTIECSKAIIYASRSGQLGRLEKLSFFSSHKYASEYRKTLEEYHDNVHLASETNDDDEPAD